MGRKKKDKRQKIPLNKYSLGGRISSLLAVAAAIMIVAAIIVSILSRGNAGTEVGVIAAAAALVSVAGFVMGIESFKEETKFLTYSWIGTLSNLAIWLMMFMMFLIYN